MQQLFIVIGEYRNRGEEKKWSICNNLAAFANRDDAVQFIKEFKENRKKNKDYYVDYDAYVIDDGVELR